MHERPTPVSALSTGAGSGALRRSRVFRARLAWAAGLVALVQLAAVASPVASRSASGEWSQERIARLVEEMPARMRAHRVPGVTVVLVARGAVSWSGGFGVTGAGEVVTADTVFQVASLGKPVFARLVELLAEERAWPLDEPLARWVGRESPVAPSELLATTSAADLLAHRSGLSFDEAADRIVFDPDARGGWRYSGAGYGVLQRAVEAATVVTLEQLAGEHLFDELDLDSMSFLPADPGGHAVGHDRSGRALPGTAWKMANAGSSLSSSALDYARFLLHISPSVSPSVGSTGGSRGQGGEWPRVLEPLATVDAALGLAWGLGWALELDGAGAGPPTAFHWGSNPGFKSFALIDFHRGLGLVILTNGDHGLELIEGMVAILDEEPHPLFGFYMLHPDD